MIAFPHNRAGDNGPRNVRPKRLALGTLDTPLPVT